MVSWTARTKNNGAIAPGVTVYLYQCLESANIVDSMAEDSTIVRALQCGGTGQLPVNGALLQCVTDSGLNAGLTSCNRCPGGWAQVPPAYRRGRMFEEIASGVLVRQSAFCQSNTILVRDAGSALLVDPGTDGDDLIGLADDLDARGVVVTLGFSTHPHWDHLLWHERFGDVARYGTAKCVSMARERLEPNQEMASRLAPGAPLLTLDRLVAVPPGSTQIPWPSRSIRILKHDGHAPGHAGLLIEDVRVLIAGDMLSDVEIPLFDPRGADPPGDYSVALDLLASASADMVIPGHGSVANGAEVGSRIEADRRYLRALLAGDDPADPRLASDAIYGPDWLPESHQRNVELAGRA
jgi:glyoxylase-like metal-dependent hydrolase (beta-lactamase superfamily II)